MNQTLIAILLSLMFYSCNNYNNKKNYEVTVNETFNIYYSTNSCCHYCISNEKNLKHVELVKIKQIDSTANCLGCNDTNAFVFKAKSSGVDTIKLKHLEVRVNCDTSTAKEEEYIIWVK